MTDNFIRRSMLPADLQRWLKVKPSGAQVNKEKIMEEYYLLTASQIVDYTNLVRNIMVMEVNSKIHDRVGEMINAISQSQYQTIQHFTTTSQE